MGTIDLIPTKNVIVDKQETHYGLKTPLRASVE
jgi:hypothetical protein